MTRIILPLLLAACAPSLTEQLCADAGDILEADPDALREQLHPSAERWRIDTCALVPGPAGSVVEIEVVYDDLSFSLDRDKGDPVATFQCSPVDDPILGWVVTACNLTEAGFWPPRMSNVQDTGI